MSNRGGRRRGAGRPLGSKNKRTAEIARVRSWRQLCVERVTRVDSALQMTPERGSNVSHDTKMIRLSENRTVERRGNA